MSNGSAVADFEVCTVWIGSFKVVRQPMSITLESVSKISRSAVSVRYAVRSAPEAWVLPEGNVPESVPHDTAAEYLRQVLVAWASDSPRDVAVARNLAVRWLERDPRIGIDPDVCILEPAPPGAADLSSVCVWKAGQAAPPLCFEVVSANHPYKDYVALQDRYAAMGTRELVVFDPLLAGPAALGGPVALQVWRRDEFGIFERIHFGDEGAFSVVLSAWLVPKGRLLVVADDPHGNEPWLTAEQRERAEKEAALVEKERERAEKERERAEKERERAEKERERAARIDVENRLRELELKVARRPPQ